MPPLQPVRFGFRCSEASGDWRIASFVAREQLSAIYSYEVELLSDFPDADVSELLGQSCEIYLSRLGIERRLTGIVSRIEAVGTRSHEHMAALITVVPALQVLAQRVNSHIFQEMTVPKILEEVLRPGLESWDRKVRMDLQREYLKREYCVQYGETDLAFVLRLMQEEGISFHFDHSDEQELMVLTDTNEAFPTLLTEDGLLQIINSDGELAEAETVRHFQLSRELQTNSVVVKEFDWTRPDLDLTSTSHSSTHQRDRLREEYVHITPATLADYRQPNYRKDDVVDQARIRREGHKARELTFEAESNVTGLAPGMVFELTGHQRPELNQKYLILSVNQQGIAQDELLAQGGAVGGQHADVRQYSNRFTCIPAEVPIRPARVHQAPRVFGPVTAKVVGPAGEEIHTDPHGRIRVQFHWDREGENNDRSSCFIRVAQTWAGLGFGSMFLPRIGMEVVVQFLDGNPDRPLVVGCVYNGVNTPPLELPDEKTRSTIRSNSSPGGDGYNELRFEDAAGSEEIFLHAQRDLTEVIKHEHSTSVGSDQSNSVSGSQTESVSKEQSLSVGGSRSKNVGKDESTAIAGNRSEQVGKDETITIQGKRTETVEKDETLTIQGARAQTVQKKESIELQDDRETTVAKNDKLGVKQNLEITVDQKYELSQGATHLTLTQNHVELNAGSYILLQHGPASIEIDQSGKIILNSPVGIELSCAGSSVKLTPMKIEASAPLEVALSGGTGAVKLDLKGATVSGPMVSSSAVAMHEVTGAVVKIN